MTETQEREQEHLQSTMTRIAPRRGGKCLIHPHKPKLWNLLWMCRTRCIKRVKDVVEEKLPSLEQVENPEAERARRELKPERREAEERHFALQSNV